MSFGHLPYNRQDLEIRWLVRRDLDEVLRIESASFATAWSEEDFLCCLRQRHCIGMVAERRKKVLGFVIYELHPGLLRVVNFAVAPEARRQRIGTQLMLKLIDKLSQQQREAIVLEVRETNLSAQLFFRSLGFRATRILKQRYEDTAEDAYEMTFRHRLAPTADVAGRPRNRISEFFDAA